MCTRYTYSAQDISVPGKEIAPRIFLSHVQRLSREAIVIDQVLCN